jgi:predicted hotdog family 3-hydroxylacyl-ACP dehydratase
MDTWDDARAFLPHRFPMVFVDRVAPLTAETARSVWRVPEAGPWVRDGLLARPALIEVAAQTLAARAGQIAAAAGRLPPPGYLGALRSVEIHTDVRAGAVLETTVELRLQLAQLVRADFEIVSAGTPVCRGVMTLAVLSD